MSTEIHTLWRTTLACCELAYSRSHPARVLLWLGTRLVHEQVVTSYAEALAVAADLRTGYA